MVYMMNNLSLSLIDNYWIKPVDNAEDYIWESVNLYENVRMILLRSIFLICWFRKYGCISENFANIDYEFIPAYDVTFISDKDNGKSVYQKYIDACADYGIDRDTMQEAMDYMVLSDFLFTNTDRHLLNLGVLRDVKTLRFVKPIIF